MLLDANKILSYIKLEARIFLFKRRHKKYARFIKSSKLKSLGQKLNEKSYHTVINIV